MFPESQRDGTPAYGARQLITNPRIGRAKHIPPMALLQSSKSIGAPNLGFRSQCELYPRLSNAVPPGLNRNFSEPGETKWRHTTFESHKSWEWGGGSCELFKGKYCRNNFKNGVSPFWISEPPKSVYTTVYSVWVRIVKN